MFYCKNNFCDVVGLVFWLAEFSLVFAITFATKMFIEDTFCNMTPGLVARSVIIIFAMSCGFILNIIGFQGWSRRRLRGRLSLCMASPKLIQFVSF